MRKSVQDIAGIERVDPCHEVRASDSIAYPTLSRDSSVECNEHGSDDGNHSWSLGSVKENGGRTDNLFSHDPLMVNPKSVCFMAPHRGSVVGSHVQGLYSSVSSASTSSLSMSNPYTSAFSSMRSGRADFGSGTRPYSMLAGVFECEVGDIPAVGSI